MHTKNTVKSLAVRVERKKDYYPIGSGVLWTANAISEYSYVFTAKHVVAEARNREVQLSIRYLNDKGEELSIDVEEVRFNETNEEIDVAVLRCRVSVGNLFIHDIEEPSDNLSDKKIIIHGFPQSVCSESSFVLSRATLDGTFLNWDSSINMFSYRIDSRSGINCADRNSEMVGFSGSGVFLVENDTYKLIGIHSGGAGCNSDLNIIKCASIKSIAEICSQNNWEVPKLTSEIDGNLKACAPLLMEMITNKDFKTSMISFLSQDYSDIIQSNFCGYAQKCEYKNYYHKCESFRAHLLILITILRGIDKDVNLLSPQIRLNSNEDKYPIKFICSEGLDKCLQITITNLVKSLKTDYSQRETIQDNSLVIWNSENRVEKNSICVKSKFDNIISDIAIEQTAKGFDIVSGKSELKGLTIIHIENLIEQINNNNFDQLEMWLSEQIQ